MTRKRLALEIGMGTDLQGRDYTKAAIRALEDALRHNSLSVAPALGYPREAMEVEVRIGVARPGEVDTRAVAAVLPYGRATVRVYEGGLDVPAADAGDQSRETTEDVAGDGEAEDVDVTIVASAAAIVWLDIDETGDA